MPDSPAQSWNLEAFVDSLIVELDSVQNRLAVKGLSRPLTYMVKDVNVDLQVFPDYDGKRVKFRTARAGENGASKIALQLGSISDRQIREATRGPVTREEMPIDTLDGIDDEVKTELKAIGVNSVSDLERVEKRGVDLKSVSKKGIDYGSLADAINKAKRRQVPPQVTRAQTMTVAERRCIVVHGKNLSVASDPRFPIARIDGAVADVVSATPTAIAVVPRRPLSQQSRLQIALDPYAILSVNVRTRGAHVEPHP